LCGRIEQAEFQSNSELRAEQCVYLGFADLAVLQSLRGFILVAVKELVDASSETGDDGCLLRGEQLSLSDERLDGSPVTGDDIDVPLIDQDALEDWMAMGTPVQAL
jgi:hypothetical protein